MGKNPLADGVEPCYPSRPDLTLGSGYRLLSVSQLTGCWKASWQHSWVQATEDQSSGPEDWTPEPKLKDADKVSSQVAGFYTTVFA